MATKPDVAIKVHDLHKEFILPQHKNASVKQAFVNIVRRNGKVVQKVLDGIDFEVHKGDFFGIVGRNGSGKSTLLKILAGVYAPTAGSVTINGGLTPFIELGVGFNPELSGRDNVFLNGALLGYSRKQMEVVYDEIVEFAELEPFMDQKLKNYSSGMQVRLAFSIAIKAKNDVLIFDEVLAVGDQAFQRKCIDIFEQYKANGQTVVLVTHDMETVKKFCNRAILISEGKLIESGDPRQVTRRYSELNQREIERDIATVNSRAEDTALHIDVLGTNHKAKQTFNVGDPLIARVRWDDLPDLESVGVNIFKESGEHITGFNSNHSGLKNILAKHEFEVEFNLNITPGKYHLLVEAYKHDGQLAGVVLDGPRFSVIAENGPAWSGLTALEHRWKA